MATCIKCSKGWNSYGAYDNFCSDKCETKFSCELRIVIKDIIISLTPHQIKNLLNALGDELIFHEIFKEELEKLNNE